MLQQFGFYDCKASNTSGDAPANFFFAKIYFSGYSIFWLETILKNQNNTIILNPLSKHKFITNISKTHKVRRSTSRPDASTIRPTANDDRSSTSVSWFYFGLIILDLDFETII